MENIPQKYSLEPEEILRLDLSKPKSAFAFFLQEKQKEGMSCDIRKGQIKVIAGLYSKLLVSEREQYEQLSLKDRTRYKEDYSTVMNCILDPLLPADWTELDFYRHECSKQDKDMSKSELNGRYSDFSSETKSFYSKLKEENLRKIGELEDIPLKPSSSFALFSKEIKDLRIKPITKTELQAKWTSLPEERRETYHQKAIEAELQRMALQHKKEFFYKQRPRKPLNAVKLFTLYLSLKGDLENRPKPAEYANFEFERLEPKEKAFYELEAKREDLLFNLKNEEFKKHFRKVEGNNVSGKQLFSKEKRKELTEESKNEKKGLCKLVNEKWEAMAEETKEEYVKKAELINAEKVKKRKELKRLVYTEPKKPCSAMKMFVSERTKELKTEGSPTVEAAKQAGLEWEKTDQAVWEAKHKQKMEEYERMKREYDSYFCYNPDEPLEEGGMQVRMLGRKRDKSLDFASEETETEDKKSKVVEG